MRDKIIALLLIFGFLLATARIAYVYGRTNGIVHAITDTTITQNGNILTFNLDGGEWIYILERR